MNAGVHALSRHAGEDLVDELLEVSIDYFCVSMDAKELNLATEMSTWMANVHVQARLSRRRALKRMRKVSVVHDFGACLCRCSDRLWERDAAEAVARKRGPVLGLASTCSWRRIRPRSRDSGIPARSAPSTNMASTLPFDTGARMLQLPADTHALHPRATSSIVHRSLCVCCHDQRATADCGPGLWLHTSIMCNDAGMLWPDRRAS